MPGILAGSWLSFADPEQEKPSSAGHVEWNGTGNSGLISCGVWGGHYLQGAEQTEAVGGIFKSPLPKHPSKRGTQWLHFVGGKN